MEADAAPLDGRGELFKQSSSDRKQMQRSSSNKEYSQKQSSRMLLEDEDEAERIEREAKEGDNSGVLLRIVDSVFNALLGWPIRMWEESFDPMSEEADADEVYRMVQQLRHTRCDGRAGWADDLYIPLLPDALETATSREEVDEILHLASREGNRAKYQLKLEFKNCECLRALRQRTRACCCRCPAPAQL